MNHCSAASADRLEPKTLRNPDGISVGLVLPCYNDAARLGRYLPELCGLLSEILLPITIQVVDDGSSPENRAAVETIVEALRSKYSWVKPAVFQESNQGKGAAILRGWDALEPAASWFGFLDADGAVPALEVCRLLQLLPAAAPNSLFASRIRMKGRTVSRDRKRHFMGRFFATLVGEMIDSGIYDCQCGFKLIPADAWRQIRPLLKEQRFAFDVDLLAALNHVGCPILEIPVDWSDIPGSKVSLISDPLRMFLAVRGIRARYAAMNKEEPSAPIRSCHSAGV